MTIRSIGIGIGTAFILLIASGHAVAQPGGSEAIGGEPRNVQAFKAFVRVVQTNPDPEYPYCKLIPFGPGQALVVEVENLGQIPAPAMQETVDFVVLDSPDEDGLHQRVTVMREEIPPGGRVSMAFRPPADWLTQGWLKLFAIEIPSNQSVIGSCTKYPPSPPGVCGIGAELGPILTALIVVYHRRRVRRARHRVQSS